MGWCSTLASHPDHVKAIGMISIENANIDLALSWLLAEMLRLPIDVAQCIYFAPNAATARIDIFKGATSGLYKPLTYDAPEEVRLWRERRHSQLFEIANRAQSLSNERNRVIHDNWGNMGDDVVRAKMSSKQDDPKVVDIKQLDSLINRMRQLIDDILALKNEFNQETTKAILAEHEALLKQPDELSPETP